MSSSKLLSGKELSAYQRWELPNVQSVSSKSPRVEEMGDDATLKPLTAEELERMQQDAHREGFEQGHKEGLASGAKEVREAVDRLQQIMDALARPLDDVDAMVTNELVSLAIAVARQIVRREIKVDPGEVVAVVREALTVLPSAARRVQILVNPEDAGLVRDFLTAQAGEDRHLRIVDDPVISRGGCRVSSEHSEIDATVEQRIAAIAAKLLGGERHGDADAD